MRGKRITVVSNERKRKVNVTMLEKEHSNFNELYEKHQVLVYRLAMKYSDRSHELSEDAVQHTFMKLYEEMEKGVEIEKIETFLHTLVKHYILNFKVKAKREVQSAEVDDSESTTNVEFEQSAEETFMDSVGEETRAQILQMLLSEMKNYNPIWYMIIREVFYKNRSQAEVAKELGMNDTAMYATIRRIRGWANKHRVRIELEVHNDTKEVPKGTSFLLGDEFPH